MALGGGVSSGRHRAWRQVELLFIYKPLTHALWWSVAPCPTPTQLYLVVVEVAVVAEDHFVRRVLVRVRVRVRVS